MSALAREPDPQPHPGRLRIGRPPPQRPLPDARLHDRRRRVPGENDRGERCGCLVAGEVACVGRRSERARLALGRAPRDPVPAACERPEPELVAADANRDRRHLGEPEADRHPVAEAVTRPGIEPRLPVALLEHRRLVGVGVEAVVLVLPDLLAGAPREPSEEADDVLVVRQRRLLPQRVARPVAGVELGQLRSCRLGEIRGELTRALVPRRLRVLAERENRLELRVEDDEIAEAVEPDPRARAETLDERPGNRPERPPRRCHLPRAAERLGADGLRHAGRPRRRTAAEREVVLPHRALLAGNHAVDERLGEHLRLLRPAGCGVDVQRADVRERMELEPVAPAGAIDDAVRAGDVGPAGRQAALLQVARVEVEHREERERARLGERVRLEPDEPQHPRERGLAAGRESGERLAGVREDRPVVRSLALREPLRPDRASEAAVDRPRVIGRAGVDERRRSSTLERRLRGRSSVSQGRGKERYEEREKYGVANHEGFSGKHIPCKKGTFPGSGRYFLIVQLNFAGVFSVMVLTNSRCARLGTACRAAPGSCPGP